MTTGPQKSTGRSSSLRRNILGVSFLLCTFCQQAACRLGLRLGSNCTAWSIRDAWCCPLTLKISIQATCHLHGLQAFACMLTACLSLSRPLSPWQDKISALKHSFHDAPVRLSSQSARALSPSQQILLPRSFACKAQSYCWSLIYCGSTDLLCVLLYMLKHHSLTRARGADASVSAV